MKRFIAWIKLFGLNKAKEKKAIQESDGVMFVADMPTIDLFGTEGMIPKGTVGYISSINETMTTYDSKYYPNVEVTYHDKNHHKQRVLVVEYWNRLKPINFSDYERK